MNFEKRCADCACLKIKNKVWLCDECFGQKCADIDDCPLGITCESVEQAESVKVKHTETSGKAKERKPREPKIDTEKVKIIADLADFMRNCAKNVVISNQSKLIEFDLGENHYKLDLIKQRKAK